jgi:hypothetical protein
MMRILSFAMVALMFASSALAKKPDAPAEFETVDEARAWVMSGKGHGEPNFFEVSVFGSKVFVGWVDPFSGRSADYAYAYVFDAKKQKWVLLDAAFIDKGGPVSFVYFDSNSDELVYVNRKGRKFKTVPVMLSP